MSEVICVACAVGLHEECVAPLAYDELFLGYYHCCCHDAPVPEPEVVEVIPAPTAEVEEEKIVKVVEETLPGLVRPREDELIRDQTSTGRKRAVKVLEALGRLKDGGYCEWAGLSRAGGGAQPIVGCDGNIVRLQKSRAGLEDNEFTMAVHHGPDKSTLDNSPSNLHAICTPCHVHWHAVNDPLYPKERPLKGFPYVPTSGLCLPHDPISRATDEERELSDRYWKLTDPVRKITPYLFQYKDEVNV
jgi:hypothetical protein